MNRQQAEKWALLLKFASDNYRVDATVFEKHLLETFPEPQAQNDALLRCIPDQSHWSKGWRCVVCGAGYRAGDDPRFTFCKGAKPEPVAEPEKKAARMWICKESFKDFPDCFISGILGGVPLSVYYPLELPSLDDPKVLDSLGMVAYTAGGNRNYGKPSPAWQKIAKSVIEAYLSMHK